MSEPRLIDRLAARLVRHRRVLIALLAVVTGMAGWGIARLKIDDQPRSIFKTDDETYARLEAVFEEFGSDDGECLIIVEADDVLAPASIAWMNGLGRKLRDVTGIDSVFGPGDVLEFTTGGLPRPLLPAYRGTASDEPLDPGVRADLLAHPVLSQLVAPDGQAACVVARIEAGRDAISQLRPVVDAVRDILEVERQSAPVRARLTGVPPIREVIFAVIQREQWLFGLLGMGLGFLMGTAVFRRPGPVLVTSTASAFAALWGLGVLGIAGQPINLMNSQLPVLILVIAFTDAVHMMVDLLHERRSGKSPLAAARSSVRHLGPACALTSFTTAVGFGSLALSRVEVIQRFGLTFAAAVGMAFFAVIGIVPLLSVLLSDKKRNRFVGRWDFLVPRAERFIRWVVRHAGPVVLVGTATTIVLLLAALRLVPDNRLTEATPQGTESVEALAAAEDHFGGVLNIAVACEWPESVTLESPELRAVLEGVERIFAESPFTQAPFGPQGLLSILPPGTVEREGLAALNRLPKSVTGRLLRPDLRRALVTARVPDEGVAVAEPAYAAIESRLDELRAAFPGYDLGLTGTGYVARRNVNLIILDFASSLLFAAGVIFIALSLAFRSVRLGALSVLPNAFPLVVPAAALALFGFELQVASAVAFTVCLGIAVDDTIHFMVRFRHELEVGDGVEEALVRTFTRVGGALLVTTAVLLGGFGVLLFSALPTTRLFGAIACTGLISALVGDLIILPALIARFGPRRAGDNRA